VVEFLYTVSVRVPSARARDRLLAWFEDDHLNHVVQGGALSGETFVRDGADFVVDVHYRFASREAFAEYEAGPAIALRAEGAALFAELGAEATRTTAVSHTRRG
jgi:hypothetical protein